MRDVCLIRNEMNRTALTNLRVLLVDRSGLLGVGVGVGVRACRACVCVGVCACVYERMCTDSSTMDGLKT